MMKNDSWDMVAEYIKGMGLRCFYNYSEWETMGNVLGQHTYMTAPIDIPLWFIRDLIVMIILAPLVYYFVKKTNIWGILLLSIAYITNIWLSTPGFSISAFFFFCTGAYFAINRKNLVDFSKRYCLIFIPLSVILFIPCVYLDGTHSWPCLMRLYIVLTVFAVFSLSSWSVEKHNIKPIPLLVNSCFFVYAAHTVFILPIAGKILHAIIPGESVIEECICYLLTPILTAGLCITIYYILTRYFKKIALPFTGGR